MPRSRPAPVNQYQPLGFDTPRSVQHALCVEHVPYPGLQFPVCILKGQDRRQVLADVAYVMGKGKDAGRVHGAELSHPTPRTARRPIADRTTR